MSTNRSGALPRWHHAARVAVVVASLMALLYVLVTVPFDLLTARGLVGQVDRHITSALREHAKRRVAVELPRPNQEANFDLDDAPVLFWRLDNAGKIVSATVNAPVLAPGSWSRSEATTADLVGGQFRLHSVRLSDGWLVAGQSLKSANHVMSVAKDVEVVVGPLFVLSMFFGALAIGITASQPVEQARRRQLEFTADASHELRTPLTVLEAEVSLALEGARDVRSYRETLQRIGTEGRRLRHIVEDLLFLARFDSAPPRPGDEPVDLVTLASTCASRFAAVAQAKGIELLSPGPTAGGMLISAPPSWVERLCGVLLDNACKYATPGGWARIFTVARAGTVALVVEDSGPGIRPAERPFLFDRFHRGDDQFEGSGLGLAIADAIVQSTSGKWRVMEAPGGGAHIEVVWRRAHPAGRARRSAQPVAG